MVRQTRKKIFKGKILSEVLTTSSFVHLNNLQMTSRIASLHVNDAPADSAVAGQLASLTLQNEEAEKFLEVGEVITSVKTPEIWQITI